MLSLISPECNNKIIINNQIARKSSFYRPLQVIPNCSPSSEAAPLLIWDVIKLEGVFLIFRCLTVAFRFCFYTRAPAVEKQPNITLLPSPCFIMDIVWGRGGGYWGEGDLLSWFWPQTYTNHPLQ